jgi:hypothetical protein
VVVCVERESEMEMEIEMEIEKEGLLNEYSVV